MSGLIYFQLLPTADFELNAMVNLMTRFIFINSSVNLLHFQYFLQIFY